MLTIDKKTIRTMSMLGACGAYGMACMDIADNDNKMLALTADLCNFSGLERFSGKFNDRLINVGIAEQNMIGIASGLAKEGFNVFVSTYASFLTTRSLDQLRVNSAYMKLPVKMVGITSGFVAGILGATHMSIEDIAIMRSLPNIIVLSPADCLETYKCIIAASKINKPVYVRLTGIMNSPIVYKEDYNYEIGKAICLNEGSDITIIATGNMVAIAQKVVNLLKDDGINCTLVNMHTIKPLDVDVIREVEESSKLVVTIEEHSIIGGLGSAVAEVLSQNAKTKLIRIGVDDYYPPAGDYNYQLDCVGLTQEKIYIKIKENINSVYP